MKVDFNRTTLCLPAPAKINLMLRVLGRRPDGYHDLETWMQKLDLCDMVSLRLRPDKEITLRCNDSSLSADRANLAWKAAEAFFAASTCAKGTGVDILLEKRIPVAAGLGGGSSDAGTVLRGLNNLFGNELSDRELLALALPLGADVPFFASGLDAVLATGVGEEMQPVPSLAGYYFLLVNPGFPVSTRWVFENYALTTGLKNSKLAGFQKINSGVLSLDDLVNDLEQITIGRYPELEDIKETLLAVGATVALMSGSGPTVFGVFPDSSIHHAQIRSIAETLHRKFGERVFVTRSQVGA